MNKNIYTRPDKPRTMAVTKRQQEAPAMELPAMPDITAVDSFSECHVTPMAVARRMVDYLGDPGDYLTLEPEAGTGNLIQTLFESGHSCYELTVIERHIGLCSEIRKRFKGDQYIDPICQCFLEYADQAVGKIEFPRIIMNPPFKRVKQHIQAALSLLGPGGHNRAVLVALVPITYHHTDMIVLEELPRDTFSTVTVATKIILFEYDS